MLSERSQIKSICLIMSWTHAFSELIKLYALNTCSLLYVIYINKAVFKKKEENNGNKDNMILA